MLIYKYDFPCIFFFKTLAYSILRRDIIQVMINVILHDVNRSESWTKRIYTSAQTYIEESSLMLLLLLLLLLLWCCCRATNIHIHIFSCTVYFSLVRIIYVKENHFHWDFKLDWKINFTSTFFNQSGEVVVKTR